MMHLTTHDPIVAEVRAARAKHAAQFGYDLQEIFRDIKARQKESNRNYVRYPSRPAVKQQLQHQQKNGITSR